MKTTELKALAEKATPGPWETRTTTHEPAGFVQGPPVDDMPYRAEILGDDYTGFGDDEQKARDVAYVAAANPAAILTLVADLESAQDERRALRAAEQNLREELAALKASIGEPVRYEWRWLNPAGVNASPEELEWKTPAPKNLESQQEFIDRLLSFRYNEKPVIGVRPLYAIKDKQP